MSLPETDTTTTHAPDRAPYVAPEITELDAGKTATGPFANPAETGPFSDPVLS